MSRSHWPRLASELEAGRLGPLSARLLVDFDNPDQYAPNDRLLTAAPSYQSGPLGKYHLATSSPLYDADKRGSRSVADAGLYHYTTRTDQLKDGRPEESGRNVVIGLHYVATASASSMQPKDTDGDGIPDYVEDANGNGQWEEGVETKINDASTVTGIHDPTNSIYDDVDLDGDGMVGRIEKALNSANPQPLVPDNPLILQATSGDWPEFRKFKLPINYDFLTGLADVRLWLETGTEPEVQALLRDNTDASTLLVWNTTFDPPGQHLLQPRIYLKTVDSSEEGAVAEACGPLLPFETDNALQFENLYSTFDANGAILYAQTYPGTEYSIELRDANGSHLNTIPGTVPMDSTKIDITWDLRGDDPGQTLYTGDSFSAAFTVTPPGYPSQTRVLHASRSALGFGEGLFTTAYRWMPNLSGRNEPFDDCIQFGVVNVLLTPGAENPHYYTSAFNRYTPLIDNYYLYGGAGHIANHDRVNALLDDLSRTENVTRNFYWDGHGAPAWIGSKDDIYILASTVAARLGNDWEIVDPIPEGPPFIRDYRNHPYRFVFINGCDAGKSGIWAEAFGIPARKIRYNEIRNHSARAQAFLGFKTPIIGVNTADACEWYRHTLTGFFKLWMEGNRPLQECFDIASDKVKLRNYLRNDLLDYDIAYEHVMPLGGPGGTSPRHTRTTELGVIYGYPFITRDGVLPPP